MPVEITCSLLEQAMETSGGDKFLIDGFPRNQDNVEGWQKKCGSKVHLLFVLFFDCSEEVYNFAIDLYINTIENNNSRISTNF